MQKNNLIKKTEGSEKDELRGCITIANISRLCISNLLSKQCHANAQRGIAYYC